MLYSIRCAKQCIYLNKKILHCLKKNGNYYLTTQGCHKLLICKKCSMGKCKKAKHSQTRSAHTIKMASCYKYSKHSEYV